jgi:hypothetical protein
MSARAMPTRFLIPPESSLGNFLSALGSSPRTFSISVTLSSISLRDSLVCSTSGKATFSKTLMESRRAAYW